MQLPNDVQNAYSVILTQFRIPYANLFMVLRTCLPKSICSYILLVNISNVHVSTCLFSTMLNSEVNGCS